MSDILSLEDDAPARRLLYTVAFLLIMIPLIMAGQQLWPLKLNDVKWRFGAANALSSVLLMPFLGLSLMVLVARVTEHKNVSRLVGAVAAMFVIGLAGSLMLFTLDALQLKSIVNSQMMEPFQTTSMRVVVVTLLFTIAFSILMLTAFKSSRGALSASRKSTKKDDSVGLIVGQEMAKAE